MTYLLKIITLVKHISTPARFPKVPRGIESRRNQKPEEKLVETAEAIATKIPDFGLITSPSHSKRGMINDDAYFGRFVVRKMSKIPDAVVEDDLKLETLVLLLSNLAAMMPKVLSELLLGLEIR